MIDSERGFSELELCAPRLSAVVITMREPVGAAASIAAATSLRLIEGDGGNG